MSPPVSDWFGRAHALAPGEGVDLVYGRDFDANEVELLELPDDLLAKVQSGEEELCFKGGPDDEAVLCTSDATYLVKRVETSNTLLLMQPPGGITPRDGAERASDAIAVASPDRTPSKRRRTASSAPSTPAEAIAQASAEAAAEAAAPSSALVAFAQAESHLELVRAEPKLDEMWSRLLAPPHVYKGPKGDRETDDAWYAALDDQDYGEEGVPDPPPKGIPLDALLAEARGSRAETTLALARGPAFAHEGGRYRGVDEEYLDYVVEIVIVTAEAKGWDLNGVPREAMADAMAEDGFPKDLTRLALRTFAREDEKKREEGGADGSSGSADAADAIDGAKVCASKAARGGGSGRFSRSGDFASPGRSATRATRSSSAASRSWRRPRTGARGPSGRSARAGSRRPRRSGSPRSSRSSRGGRWTSWSRTSKPPRTKPSRRSSSSSPASRSQTRRALPCTPSDERKSAGAGEKTRRCEIDSCASSQTIARSSIVSTRRSDSLLLNPLPSPAASRAKFSPSRRPSSSRARRARLDATPRR